MPKELCNTCSVMILKSSIGRFWIPSADVNSLVSATNPRVETSIVWLNTVFVPWKKEINLVTNREFPSVDCTLPEDGYVYTEVDE